MTEVDSIADLLERGFRGGAWHGPAVAEALAGLDAATGAAPPLAGAHSIWEIVHHLAGWNEVPRRRLDGERLQNLPPERDWPPAADLSADAWQATLAALQCPQAALHADVFELATC